MNIFQNSATVLYDRAFPSFQPLSLLKKHELFMKLSLEYPNFLSKTTQENGIVKNIVEESAFTEKRNDGSVAYKLNRPAILVSSTSWTPDEDFEILLKALESKCSFVINLHFFKFTYFFCLDYENVSKESQSYPDLLCIITGKGPQRQHYLDIIESKEWSRVSILTPWLETEDYPQLLASADLGVCLHISSSGLDLPMKVVDMFGCGLPVCAINFKW